MSRVLILPGGHTFVNGKKGGTVKRLTNICQKQFSAQISSPPICQWGWPA